MSEFDGGGAETTAPETTTESVDAQLNEMRQAETQEAAPERVAEPTEQRDLEAPKTVPLAALHESRERLKEERRAREEAERQSTLRFQLLEQRLHQLASPPPQAPSRQDDPVAYFDHQINELRSVAHNSVQQNNELRQALQAQAQEDQMTVMIRASESEITKTTPDFLDAINHMRVGVEREFEAYGIDPVEAKARAAHQFKAMAFQALQMGKNPAEMAYQLAQARGYQKPTTQPDAAAKLAAEGRGVAASRTLGNGGQAAGRLTLESLSQMSDEDFAKVKDSDWRRAMGG
ncbi:hypothetical protein VLK31_34910 [Variovorax sp. H27-G14]|uniref:hypothetical protein n=1 Tax=Variovorax sp. H27-G14 TaxID=3111914 RepID=UPI0038FC6F8F